MATQSRYEIATHPAQRIITDVSAKLLSLTDADGVQIFPNELSVRPLEDTPPLVLDEKKCPYALLTFGDEGLGVSTATQFDENFWYGYLYLYLIISNPSQTEERISVRLQQMNLHRLILLNIRDNSIPLNSTDTVPSAFGMEYPLRNSSNSAIWRFGGLDKQIVHSFNVPLKRFLTAEEVGSGYFVSGIKLPFFCDMRVDIA